MLVIALRVIISNNRFIEIDHDFGRWLLFRANYRLFCHHLDNLFDSFCLDWLHTAAQLLDVFCKFAMFACVVDKAAYILLIALAAKSDQCAFLILP